MKPLPLQSEHSAIFSTISVQTTPYPVIILPEPSQVGQGLESPLFKLLRQSSFVADLSSLALFIIGYYSLLALRIYMFLFHILHSQNRYVLELLHNLRRILLLKFLAPWPKPSYFNFRASGG